MTLFLEFLEEIFFHSFLDLLKLLPFLFLSYLLMEAIEHKAGERMQNIIAEVPMSEMSNFAVAMRSIAQGRATFDFEFARYEEAPQNIA